MKNLISYSLLLLSSTFVMAQSSISDETLHKIRNGYEPSPTSQALQNAVSANSIKTLVVNQANRGEKDMYFSHMVPSKGITNQKSSGRCWLFTGLNVLRPRIIKQYNLAGFEFSYVHLFFYDQLEKSNLFLQGVIDYRNKPMEDKMVEWLFKNPLSDGGTYTGVADLVAKYGAIPQGVMPETYNSENTSQVSALMKRKLREYGMTLRIEAAKGIKLAALEQLKVEMLQTIYRMLVMAYGEPPQSFEWAPKAANGKYLTAPQTYTPRSFYETYFNEDLNNDYVMVMNDASRPYHKVYEIDYDRHTYDGHNWLYLNLPVEEIKQMAIASIKDSTMMYFSCDVNKELDATTGMLDLDNYAYGALFGTEFTMDKATRIKSFDSGSSHAMALMAVDLDEQGQAKKWMVENSWGATHGFKGHLVMTDRWFDEYMFRLVVNKKYVPAATQQLLKQKPIALPAWDPMFMPEN